MDNINLLFDDENIVVCEKPVGVQSQNDKEDDMIKILSSQLDSKIYPVHRLDTAVGGVMVFAKNAKTAAYLSKQITDGTFKKTYLAVISGYPEEKKGIYEDLLFKDSRKNKSFVVKRERRGVKKASLEYKVLENINNVSLVKILLHTGRTHQIRVQFSSRKMPLLGDGKYGSREKCNIALWSHAVEFYYKNEKKLFSLYPKYSIYPWSEFCMYNNI